MVFTRILNSASSLDQVLVNEIPAARDRAVGWVPAAGALPPGVVVLMITPEPDFLRYGSACLAG